MHPIPERRRVSRDVSRLLFLLFLCCATPRILPAEPAYTCAARLDHSFIPTPLIRVPLFVNSRTFLEVLPDDRIIIGGRINQSPGVVRLQSDGQLDTTFVPLEIPEGLGDIPRVNAIALQSYGKLLVAGWLSHLEVPLVRLHADGTLDEGFAPQFQNLNNFQPTIDALAVSDSDQIYLSGNFTHVNGTFRRGLARLNANGSRDDSFVPNFLPNGDVLVSIPLIHPTTNGLLVVVQNELLLLDSSGATNASFQRFNAPRITALALDEQQRILVGHMATLSQPLLTRLLPNGKVDETFSPEYDLLDALGGEGIISIFVQPDGKIFVGGSFTDEANRTPSLARFFPDGRLDTAFSPIIQQNGWADDVESVTDIGMQSSGKLIVTGDFALIDGTDRRGVARLYRETNDCPGLLQFTAGEMSIDEASGNAAIQITRSGDLSAAASVFIDLLPSDVEYNGARPGEDYLVGNTKIGFAPGEASKVFSLPIVNDGNVETPEALTARLRGVEGAVLAIQTSMRIIIRDDDSTALTGMPQPVNYGTNIIVLDIAVDSISRAIVGGSFTNIAGQPRTNLVRLSADGTIDPAFFPGGLPFVVYAIHIINGYGPILIGGENTFVKLHPDGTVDTSFNVTLAGPSPRVNEILVQPDGKMVIAGRFQSVNGTTRHGIARLHENGTLDASFDPPGGIANLSEWSVEPTGLAQQPDGKILIAGNFLGVGGFENFGLVRLDTNGVPDRTFAPRVNGAIGALLLQSDGKIVIGGDFDQIGQRNWRGLARLSASGSLDETFFADVQIDSRQYTVTDLQLGWDGNLYAAGKFLFVGVRGIIDGLFRRGVARFNANGAVDSLFYTGMGANGPVNAIGFGLDRSLLVGGEFTQFNGEDHHGLVRLHGDNLESSGRISFARSSFVDTEGSASLAVVLVRQWGTNGTISARYSTRAITATPGTDYQNVSGTVTFLPGERIKQFIIPLLNDSEVELGEAIEIKLTDGPLGLIPNATFSIQDDEVGFVFEQKEYRVNEGSDATVRVLYTGGVLGSSVNLRIQTRAGTAADPHDYAFQSHSVTITQNTLPAIVTVPIHPDGFAEQPENFFVEIVEASQPFPLGPPATVIIRDSAEAGLFLEAGSLTEDEFRLTVATSPGMQYNIYVSDDLENWSLLDRIYAYTDSFEVVDRPPDETNVRFYKVELYQPY